MTALADTPLAPVSSETTARSAGGSKPLALATLAAPLLLAAGVVVHPDDTQGVEKTLTAIAGDSSALWTFTHLLEPFAWGLFAVTLLLALPRMAGARGGTLLKVGAVLTAIGYGSIALIVYGHGESYRFMAETLSSSSIEPAVYGPLFEQFEKALPLAALPSLLGKIGTLVAVAGLVRARTVPVWAALCLVPSAVVMGSGMPFVVGLVVFFGPLTVGVAMIARRVARTGGPALG